MQDSRHDRPQQRRSLLIVLLMTGTFIRVIEVVGGLLTGSLALLADAGHMLTDVAALGLSAFAMQMAARPSTPEGAPDTTEPRSSPPSSMRWCCCC